MEDTGRNGGITGLLDLPGVADSTAKFRLRVYLAKESLSASENDRAGRGDGDYPESGYLTSTGLMIAQGELNPEGYYRPTAFIGQAGTVTVQWYDGATDTVPVKVLTCTVERDEKGESNPRVTLSMRITAEPTLAGFGGTQATGTTAALADKKLYAGLAKRTDPSGLITAGQQVWDIAGITDTDAAEVTAIGVVVAAYVASITGLKIKYSDFRRLTSRRCQITLTEALTTTAQDIELPNSPTTDDPQDLEGETVVTVVTESGTPPAPSAPSGLVPRTTLTVQLNDGKWRHTFTYARRTTADDITFPGTVTFVDPNAIASEGTITVIGASSTPDAAPAAPTDNTKHVGTSVRQHTSAGKWVWTYQYKARDSKDDIEMPGTRADADAQDLEDGGETTVVTDDATVPATPSAPGTSVLTLVSSTQQSDGKWAHVFRFGPTNTQQAKEYPGTTSIIDPSALRDGGTALVVNGSSTPPATPSAPGASKLIATESTRLTAGGKWQHVFRFGPQTSADEITMRAEVTDDPSGVAKKGNVITIQSTATPATAPSTPIAGTVFRTVTTRQLKDGQYEQDYQYGMSTPAHDISNPENRGQSDPNGLETVAFNAALNTPPAYGTGEPYLMHNRLIDDAGNILYTAESRPRSSVHEITFRNSSVRTDPHKLDGEERITEIVSSGGDATGTATQVELQKIGTIRQKETSSYDRVTDVYDTLDSQQKRTFPNLKTLVDPSSIADWETKSEVVDTTDAATTVAPAAPANLYFHHRDTQQLTPDSGTAAGQSMVIYHYRHATTEDELLRPHLEQSADPNSLEDFQTATALWDTTGAEPSAPSLPSGFLLVATRYIAVPDHADRKVIVYRYGRNDTKTSIERPGTMYRAGMDVTYVKRDTSVVTVAATATAQTIALAQRDALLASTAAADVIDLKFVTAEKLTETTARVVFDRETAGIRIKIVAYGGMEWVNVVNAGGTLYVRTGQVRQRGTSNYEVQVLPSRIWIGRLRIFITRTLMTTGGGNVESNLGFLGTKNNATFLGLTTGTVGWVGRHIDWNYDLGTAHEHPYGVTDELEYRSTGIYDDAGAVPGTYTISSSVSAFSLVAASSIGFASALLTGADYSPLVA